MTWCRDSLHVGHEWESVTPHPLIQLISKASQTALRMTRHHHPPHVRLDLPPTTVELFGRPCASPFLWSHYDSISSHTRMYNGWEEVSFAF